MNMILYNYIPSFRLTPIQVNYYKMPPLYDLWDVGMLLFMGHKNTPYRGYQHIATYLHTVPDQGTWSVAPIDLPIKEKESQELGGRFEGSCYV